MGRMYRARTSGVTLNEIRDVWEVVAPTDGIVVIHKVVMCQLSDVGDAQEEQLLVEVVRGVGTVTSGSGGSTPTPEPILIGDALFGGTTEANNTTRMAVGTGSLDTMDSMSWNIRDRFELLYLPEERPIIAPGDRWTIALPAAPADSFTGFGSSIVFEEIG